MAYGYRAVLDGWQVLEVGYTDSVGGGIKECKRPDVILLFLLQLLFFLVVFFVCLFV